MRVRAEITAAFKSGVYTPKNTYDVSDFFIDSALDTDTDSFQITIGDFENDFTALLHRDSEVRVNLFVEGNGQGNFKSLQTGIADEVAWDDEGTMVINGRDFTCIAVDSAHPPARYTKSRPEKIVTKEARAIGIGSNLKLGTTTGKWPVFKELATDGSESYWQFWYRLYRKRRMWLWAEPDGALIASELNYNQHPAYYFGDSFGLSSKYSKINFIEVESMSWRANKQSRVATVYVIGNRGDKKSFLQKAIDPSMNHWIKKPNAIITSKSAHGPGEAHAEALEELFESKVGATEISLTIADPGLIIRQNRMCFVNISGANVRGEFYVVGTRILGSVDGGLYQEVRLREKNYAISRRVPSDPILLQGPGDSAMFGPTGPGGFGPNNPAGSISESVARAIGAQQPNATNWGQYFVEAADKQRGPWPFALFLGVILSIAKHETNFRNIRHNGMAGPDYPGRADGHIPSIVTENAAYNQFVSRYANDPKYGRIDHIEAVGPMQLYTQSYKEYADRASGSSIDELVGGRWQVRYNVLAGAYALRSKLKGLESALNPANASQAYSLIWQGVAAYGASDAYMGEIKLIYDTIFSEAVTSALQTAKAITKGASRAGWTFEFARQATGGVGNNLGGPADHQARPLHNWQSDNAYDIGVPVGTSVYSLSAGVVGDAIGVQSTRPNDGMRLTVGDLYWYGHLSSIAVKPGQNVKKGQLLGKSGKSQNGVAHLHVGYNDGGNY